MAGIKSGYPRISERAGRKFGAYLQLLRPLTLSAPILGGMAGGLMGYKAVYGNIPALDDLWIWWRIVFGMVTLLLIQAGNNVLNQAAESELDSRGKPYRPIPKGLVSKDEGYGLVLLLYAVATFRVALVNEMFSLLALSLIVLTVIYSVKPLYLKSRLWWGALNLGLARGALGFLAAYSIFGDPWQPLPMSIALVLAVYVFGTNGTKDFADKEADEEFGIRTLATVYGSRARYFVAPFFLIPYPLIMVLIHMQYLPASFFWMLLLLPVGIWSFYVTVSAAVDTEMSITENSVSWVVFYANLGLLFLGFGFVYLLWTW